MQTATFAGGCFWCTEAVFQRIKGVINITPGYTGGRIEDPTYEQICAGFTGHAEAINIEYDPKKVSFEDLMEIFFDTHDPTQLNQQGADAGTQYRSAIFYRNNKQKEQAEKFISKLEKIIVDDKEIKTTLEPFAKFYKAEDYHLNYYKNNPNKVYCKLVITPKIKKLEKDHKKFLN